MHEVKFCSGLPCDLSRVIERCRRRFAEIGRHEDLAESRRHAPPPFRSSATLHRSSAGMADLESVAEINDSLRGAGRKRCSLVRREGDRHQRVPFTHADGRFPIAVAGLTRSWLAKIPEPLRVFPGRAPRAHVGSRRRASSKRNLSRPRRTSHSARNACAPAGRAAWRWSNLPALSDDNDIRTLRQISRGPENFPASGKYAPLVKRTRQRAHREAHPR